MSNGFPCLYFASYVVLSVDLVSHLSRVSRFGFVRKYLNHIGVVLLSRSLIQNFLSPHSLQIINFVKASISNVKTYKIYTLGKEALYFHKTLQ